MKAAGFTLLETLVSITLLAFLAMGLTASLRIGLAYPGMAQGLTRIGPVAAVQSFLRRELSSALALPSSDWQGVAFQGAPTALEMIGPMPERAAAGGLHEVTLFLKQNQLVLRWRRLDPPEPAREKVLLGDVAAVDMAYWGARRETEPADWFPEWRAASLLPALVRIRLHLNAGAGAWPELIIAIPTQPDELHP